jgi:hypothetical protein
VGKLMFFTPPIVPGLMSVLLCLCLHVFTPHDKKYQAMQLVYVCPKTRVGESSPKGTPVKVPMPLCRRGVGPWRRPRG